MRRGLARSLFIAAASVLVLAQVAAAAEFSADFVEKIGSRGATGKVYLQGVRMRREMTQGGQKAIVILRPDRHVVWMLNPAQKTYMEMATGQDHPRPLNDPKLQQELKKRGTLKRLGQETVAGYLCDKYQFVPRQKGAGTMVQWVSRRLKFPLKTLTRGARAALSIEYKNVKEGKVAATLFEIPRGYKKVSPPRMQGMPKAAPRPK